MPLYTADRAYSRGDATHGDASSWYSTPHIFSREVFVMIIVSNAHVVCFSMSRWSDVLCCVV
jgi:hypothetical protein